MVGQSDERDNQSEFDPYEPGEAALDPSRDPERGRDSDLQITISDPPAAPTLARAAANSRVILDRFSGPVGAAWMLTAVFGVVALTLFGMASREAAESVSGPGAEGLGMVILTWMPTILVGVVVATLLIGLIRPLRRISFHGPETVSEVSEVFSAATERFWRIAGMLVVWSVLWMAGLTAVIAVTLGTQLEVSDFAVGLFALLSYPAVAPLFYVLSATDFGYVDAVATCVDVLFRHVGYLVIPLVLAGVGAFLYICSLGCFASSPFIGTGLMILVVCAMWLLLFVVFATIEEAEGAFDPAMTRRFGGPDTGPPSGMAEPRGTRDGRDDSDPEDGSNVEW